MPSSDTVAADASEPDEIDPRLLRYQDILNENGELHGQLFDAKRRAHAFARSLGFATIDEAEKAVAEQPKLFYRVQIENNHHRLLHLRREHENLVKQLAVKDEELSLKAQALTDVKSQLEALKLAAQIKVDSSATGKENSQPLSDMSSTSNSPAKPMNPPLKRATPKEQQLSAKIAVLQERYDHLLRAKQRSAALYSKDIHRWERDYEKWRKFKDWLFGVNSKGKSRIKQSMEDAHARIEDMPLYPSISLYDDKEDDDESDDGLLHEVKDEDYSFPLRMRAVSLPPRSPAKPASKYTTPALNRHVPLPKPNTSRGPMPPSRVLVPSSSEPDLADTSPRKAAKRKFFDSDSETEPESQSQILLRLPPLFKVPRPKSSPPSTIRQDRRPLKKVRTHGEHDAVEKPVASSSTIRLPSDKQGLLDPLGHVGMKTDLGSDMKFKARGRYAKHDIKTEDDTTINARFAIDTSRNDGVPYEFHSVVRNREERRHLAAEDCECCRDYYQAVGPLPERLQQPRWRSPSAHPGGERSVVLHDTSHVKTIVCTEADITNHRGAISRHRAAWPRAPTPPGYWNIGFPDTQEVAEVNERAKEMRLEKMKRIQREAAKPDGKYRQR